MYDWRTGVSIRVMGALIGLVCCLGTAHAVEVYVNGVRVTGGIKNQVFQKVTVQFDANGDVRITAPGFKIEVEGQPAAAPPVVGTPAVGTPAVPPPVQQAPTGKRYWLIMDASQPGHYQVQILLNGKIVADIPAKSQQYVMDLSEKMVIGSNMVQVIVLPQPGAPVVPPTEAFNLMVGEGVKAADGTLTISRVHGTVKQPTGRASAESHTIKLGE